MSAVLFFVDLDPHRVWHLPTGDLFMRNESFIVYSRAIWLCRTLRATTSPRHDVDLANEVVRAGIVFA